MVIAQAFPAWVRPASHRVEGMPLIDLPVQAAAKLQQYVERGAAELHYLRKIIESGAFRLEPPLNYAALAADIEARGWTRTCWPSSRYSRLTGTPYARG